MDSGIALYKNYLKSNGGNACAETIYFLDKIAYHKNLTQEQITSAENEILEDLKNEIINFCNNNRYNINQLDRFKDTFEYAKAIFSISQHVSVLSRTKKIDDINIAIKLAWDGSGYDYTTDEYYLFEETAWIEEMKTVSTNVSYAGISHSYKIIGGTRLKAGNYTVSRKNNKKSVTKDMGKLLITEDSVNYIGRDMQYCFKGKDIQRIEDYAGEIIIFVKGRVHPYKFRVHGTNCCLECLRTLHDGKFSKPNRWNEYYKYLISKDLNQKLPEFNELSKQWLSSSMSDVETINQLEAMYGGPQPCSSNISTHASSSNGRPFYRKYWFGILVLCFTPPLGVLLLCYQLYANNKK